MAGLTIAVMVILLEDSIHIAEQRKQVDAWGSSTKRMLSKVCVLEKGHSVAQGVFDCVKQQNVVQMQQVAQEVVCSVEIRYLPDSAAPISARCAMQGYPSTDRLLRGTDPMVALSRKSLITTTIGRPRAAHSTTWCKHARHV